MKKDASVDERQTLKFEEETMPTLRLQNCLLFCPVMIVSLCETFGPGGVTT